ncbi:MAG: hypothetical protein C4B59_04645 [Candidatus Methanogaster sp.]|uniref:Uncharacterized protein n=1 Tax=Candidatus Methanogaster sp. TaxID=3386292 RepID=A0AC61L4C2_9EURY|nr:MAG: hypothetical protein C4B59_04645 [ANME-2 cluster archaeon]
MYVKVLNAESRVILTNNVAKVLITNVVSDSSSLIFLSAFGLLDILRIGFGEVAISEAVYQEVTAKDLKGSD